MVAIFPNVFYLSICLTTKQLALTFEENLPAPTTVLTSQFGVWIFHRISLDWFLRENIAANFVKKVVGNVI